MDFISRIASRIASEPLNKNELESKYKLMEISLNQIWETMDEIEKKDKRPSPVYPIIKDAVDDVQKLVEDLKEDTELRFK